MYIQITISLSIYRGVAVTKSGFMYFMLGINLLGFAVLEIIMVSLPSLSADDLNKHELFFTSTRQHFSSVLFVTVEPSQDSGWNHSNYFF